MKKCLIVLWYGKFPNYFDFFLKSCEWNPGWDWMIYTDQEITGLQVPSNVKFVSSCFSDMKRFIADKLEIKLFNKITPYKLCDIKPLYGKIFSSELERGGYSYWGHCDIDVIWGDLSKFYPDALIEQYDRFLCWGHLTLYRNTKDNNEFYKKACFKYFDYRAIIASKYIWGFDEYRKYALLRIQERESGYRIYKDRQAIADVSPWDGYKNNKGMEHGKGVELKPIEYVRVDKGSIYIKYLSENSEMEMAYAHFQKRMFDILPIKDKSQYYILSNTFCSDKDYKGREIIKSDNRAVNIKFIQLCKIFEVFWMRLDGILSK